MSHWLVEILIRIRDILVVLPLSLFHVKNCVCLSRGVYVTGAAWQAATRIMAGIWDLVQRTGDGHTGRILSGRMIGRSGDVVCDLHCAQEDEEREFFGWASKPRLTVYQWFGLKITGTVSPGLASKPVEGFPIWASKSVATVWWFVHQNHCGGFLVCASKPSGLWFIGCATKPTGGWRRHGVRVEI
jgi:hypothetical protein